MASFISDLKHIFQHQASINSKINKQEVEHTEEITVTPCISTNPDGCKARRTTTCRPDPEDKCITVSQSWAYDESGYGFPITSNLTPISLNENEVYALCEMLLSFLKGESVPVTEKELKEQEGKKNIVVTGSTNPKLDKYMVECTAGKKK